MITFTPFNPYENTRVYRRNLPHWQQHDATYFVTFRLSDAVPKHVADGWRRQKKAWLRAHGIDMDETGKWKDAFCRLPFDLQQQYQRLLGSRLDTYLDRGAGSCFLRKPDHAACVKNALRFFDKQRLECGDFVIMPNHIHWLVKPLGHWSLESILHSVKGYTGKLIAEAESHSGRIWQRESYDHIIRNECELSFYRDYIARNPVKARLSGKDFVHCEAEWYVRRT